MSFEWSPSGGTLSVLHEEGEQTLNLWPSVERLAALSVTEPYRFIAGRLYHGQELIADWGEESQMQRLADGRFLLAVNRSLYLGDGLKSFPTHSYSEAEWNLRRWRYEKLITPTEYLKLLKEID
jgi:hypothetical protein